MIDHDADLTLRGYYKAVVRRAWDDSMTLLHANVVFSVALLVAGIVVGLTFSWLSLVAIALVCVVVLLANAVKAPVALANDARVQAAATEAQLAQKESAPVSTLHRDELRLVAITLLEYIDLRVRLTYLPPDEPRPNLADAFREHFPDLASGLDGWTSVIKQREDRRDTLMGWAIARVRELGYGDYPYSGRVAELIATTAEMTEPELEFSTVAGHLHASGFHVYLPNEGDEQAAAAYDQERVERDLRDLVATAADRQDREHLMIVLREIDEERGRLTVDLELIRDRDTIQTGPGCKLCR